MKSILDSTPKNSNQVSTVVFVDAGVENYQQLVNGVIPTAEVFVLDAAADGIEQISQVLQQRQDVGAVHIISHGAPGCLYLGNSQLSLDTFNRYATQLQQWDVANLLLYGCNVAAGDAGAEFIAKLQALTGAEIAASKSLTGSAAKGGNWELEVTTAQIQPTLVLQPEAMANYSDVLADDPLKLEWAKGFDSKDNSYSYVNGLDTDSSGNVYAAGRYNGNIDLDGNGTVDLTSNGNYSFYVAKFDTQGNLAWANGFASNDNSSSRSYLYGLDTDSSGNVYAGGAYEANIDLDGNGTVDLTSNGNYSSYIAKFDTQGNLAWAKGFASNDNSSGYSYIYGLDTDSSDNIYAGGGYQGNIDLDGNGTVDLTSNGNYGSSYIAKFDTQGNLAWAKGFASNDNSYNNVHQLDTDSSANVYAGGGYQGNIDLDGNGTVDLTSNGNEASYIAKFDTQGNLAWVKGFASNDNSSSRSYLYGLDTDSSGNVYAVGRYQGNIDLDGNGTVDLTSNGNEASYIAKFDIQGNLAWAKGFASNDNSSSPSYVNGLDTDSSGNIYAGGQYNGNIDLDGNGTVDLSSNGNGASYIVQFSAFTNAAPTVV